MSLTNRHNHQFTRLASSAAQDHATPRAGLPRHVLISGAGIAGPTVAFWLHKYGIKSTLVERAPDIRTAGQTIDVRGAAWKVIEQMGIADAIRANATHEEGVHFVNEANETQVSFKHEGVGGFIVAEVEIPRFSFCEVLYEATRDNTEYIFGDSIASIVEHPNGATVSFVSGAPSQDFDIVVLADGYASRTRRPIFGPDEDFVKPLGQYSGYFSIPYLASDGVYSRWFNATGGRWIWIRPDKQNGVTRAFLSHMTPANGFEKLPAAQQKAKFRELFQDVGWESKRVLDGMDACQDFYCQLVAQVKMPKWSKGRVVLVGDAAYCPSPLSGNGTYAAIMGAYILAGEIAKNEDHSEALASYEATFRPCMKLIQDTLPLGLVAPQTNRGIWFRNQFLWVISLILRTGIKLLVEPWTRDTYVPPDYSNLLRPSTSK